MKRIAVILLFILTSAASALAQSYTISGTVLDKKTGEPVDYATVLMTRTEQWAMADAKGHFSIKNVPAGKNIISISCLGYVTDEKEIIVSKDIDNYCVRLSEDNLTLESVVITAQENTSGATTSRTMDRTALDHMQMTNLAEASSLMPGGTTENSNLTSSKVLSVRSESGEGSLSTFGTAVEVDGVRLSTNAMLGLDPVTNGIKGASVNNIATSNIESVEVITGVPGVEYGDMTSGVVKVNTRKGKTPFEVTMSTNPKTKQISINKGFGLGETRTGKNRGVINAGAEYTRAISELMSPYSAYNRRQINLSYTNTFVSGGLSDMPLRFTAGITGNWGGYNSKADPDSYGSNWASTNDSAVRGNFSLSWLLSKSWITNIELNSSLSYSNKLYRYKSYDSSASTKTVLHGTEEGYFMGESYEQNPDAAVMLIPPGQWTYVMNEDNRPLNWKVGLKANWARKFGIVNNKLKIGADWTGDGNLGKGWYAEDQAYAPTYRKWDYSAVPFMHNIAVYAEETVHIPIGKTKLDLVAGIRNENTVIKGSAYGTKSTWSPRFNAKYTIFNSKDRRHNVVKDLSFRASWGVAMKLPSFSILFPVPSYKDINAFNTHTTSSGENLSAYYILPRTIEYNSGLKLQKTRQSEAGVDINIGGYKISLVGFYNKTLNGYRIDSGYEDFVYYYTPVTAITEAMTGDNLITEENRIYSIDRSTGTVTVSDKTGAKASVQLQGKEKKSVNTTRVPGNDVNPATRWGLEWVVDFKKIKAINTTVRLDGTYYRYKSVDANTVANCPTNTNDAYGEPYTYIGYYYGGSSLSNGRENRALRTNLTVTTHIPKVRLIVSVKLEASLYRYSHYLSERADGSARSYLIENREDYFTDNSASIYGQKQYTVLYPDYYTVYGSSEKIPFLEKFKWAKENDTKLFNDLAKLVQKTSYTYFFLDDVISPYFSANISVTKEIGDIASISFYANNFFNNHGKVKSSKTGKYTSLASSGYIPDFFYGLTLRLKF